MAHNISPALHRHTPLEAPISEGQIKRKIHRRRGACEPCRISKIKCDGKQPCGSCRYERRKHHPCVYSDKIMKSKHISQKARRRMDQEHLVACEESPPHSPDSSDHENSSVHERKDLPSQYSPPTPVSAERFRRRQTTNSLTLDQHESTATKFHSLSICAMVDEFKGLKPVRGISTQIVSRCSGFEVLNQAAFTHTWRRAHVDPLDGSAISTSSEIDSAASRLSLSLRLWNSQLDQIDSLIASSKFHEAWVELASTIRGAELLDVPAEASSNDECQLFKNAWTRSLDTESQLGLLLGRSTYLLPRRPVCSPAVSAPGSESENDVVLHATKFDLYRHIHGLTSLDQTQPAVSDHFLRRAFEILMHEQFNRIGLCTKEDDTAAVRNVQLDIHLLFMVTYCRLASMCDKLPKNDKTTFHAEVARNVGLYQPRSTVAYCRKMFRSADFIISIFLNLYDEDPDRMTRDLIRCASVFHTALIIGIAKVRGGMVRRATIKLLDKVQKAFAELADGRPDCVLFRTAVTRLQELDSFERPTVVKYAAVPTLTKPGPNDLGGAMTNSTMLPSHRGSPSGLTLGLTSPVEMGEDSMPMAQWSSPLHCQTSARSRPHHRELPTMSTEIYRNDSPLTESASCTQAGSAYPSNLSFSDNRAIASATTSSSDTICYEDDSTIKARVAGPVIFGLSGSGDVMQRAGQTSAAAITYPSPHTPVTDSGSFSHATSTTHDVSMIDDSASVDHTTLFTTSNRVEDIRRQVRNVCSTATPVGSEANHTPTTVISASVVSGGSWSAETQKQPFPFRGYSDPDLQQIRAHSTVGQSFASNDSEDHAFAAEHPRVDYPQKNLVLQPATASDLNSMDPGLGLGLRQQASAFTWIDPHRAQPISCAPTSIAWYRPSNIIPIHDVESSFMEPSTAFMQQTQPQYPISATPVYSDYTQFFQHGQEFVRFG